VAIAEVPVYAPAAKIERRDPFEPAPIVPVAGRTEEGAASRVPWSAPSQKFTAPVPSSAHSQEVHALDRAIALLRRDHDAAAALAELDAYLDRFPHGLLHREARLARLDALLMLQRTDEALAALETLPLDSGRRSTELQVVRAELRARTDCSRAEQDFDVALTHSPNAALLERILYGRGSCRAKSGKAPGAADDLGRYLEHFPNGAHAKWARQWLDTIGKPSVKGG
jgi:TolA-binding protein